MSPVLKEGFRRPSGSAVAYGGKPDCSAASPDACDRVTRLLPIPRRVALLRRSRSGEELGEDRNAYANSTGSSAGNWLSRWVNS